MIIILLFLHQVFSRDFCRGPSYANHTPTWAETAGGATCYEPLPLRGTPVYKAPEETVGCEASWATVLFITGVVVSLFSLTCAILFYCGGGGRWCRAEPSDTPSSRSINGIKEVRYSTFHLLVGIYLFTVNFMKPFQPSDFLILRSFANRK